MSSPVASYPRAEASATAVLARLQHLLEDLAARLRTPNLPARAATAPAILDKCRSLCAEAESLAATAATEIPVLVELAAASGLQSNKYAADRIARSFNDNKLRLAELAAQVATVITTVSQMSSSSSSRSAAAAAAAAAASVALGDDNKDRDNNYNNYNNDEEDEDDDTPLLRRQQQQLLARDSAAQREAAYSQALVAEREADIRNIESGLIMVQDVFVKIGSLVTEQGHDIDHIEANIEEAQTFAEQGASELVVADQRASNAGWWKCIVFLVLLIICLILGVFVYLKASARNTNVNKIKA